MFARGRIAAVLVAASAASGVFPAVLPRSVSTALLSTAGAQSTGTSSRALEFRFTPTGRAQLALWIEKPDGTFLKTVGLTQSVSYYGIGNRPGAAQMNSGFRWPYGRREGALPIWAHRRLTAPGAAPFKRVIFQNRESEGFASRTSNDSSNDSYFCLSFNQATEVEQRRRDFLDAITCASSNSFMSDKGRFVKEADAAAAYAEPAQIAGSGVMRPLDTTSLYPPRRDVRPCADAGCIVDTPDVAQFGRHAAEIMPDIDAVTMATPAPEVEHAVMFTVPQDWADGEYVAWIEVNVEGDYNAAFNQQTHPTPTQPPNKWDSWAISSGYPYRGQPSVAFKIPFTLGASGSVVTAKPAFYGDVDGFGAAGGELHPMDGRISDDPMMATGKGADRLRLIGPSGHRLKVTVRGRDLCAQNQPPAAPSGFKVAPVANEKFSHEWGDLQFVVPASPVAIAKYEVRFSTSPILVEDPASFERALPALANTTTSEALSIPVTTPPGDTVLVPFGGMRHSTRYYVAIRAVNMCNTAGPYVVADLTTTKINFTQLSGCFIATAAYGGAWEPQVDALRQARDDLRNRSALFTLATDLYYRSGPAAAAVISRSDVARAVVRTLLGPMGALANASYGAMKISR